MLVLPDNAAVSAAGFSGSGDGGGPEQLLHEELVCSCYMPVA
jgi:hypothetical protein